MFQWFWDIWHVGFSKIQDFFHFYGLLLGFKTALAFQLLDFTKNREIVDVLHYVFSGVIEVLIENSHHRLLFGESKGHVLIVWFQILAFVLQFKPVASWLFPNRVNGRNLWWILSHESRVFLPFGWLGLARFSFRRVIFFFRWVIWLLIFIKLRFIFKFHDWTWDRNQNLVILDQKYRLLPFIFDLMIAIINKVLSVVFFRSFKNWMLTWCFLLLINVGIAWIFSTRVVF